MNNLILRSFGGLLFLLVVLGLLLFIPAGSLAYWQAWLFLAVFGVCVVLITAHLMRNDQGLLARRVDAGPGAETDPTQKLIQSVAGLCFILIFILSGLDYRFHWSSVPVWLVVLAEVLVALGLYVVFLVFRENSYTSAVVTVAAGQKVVTTGPYAVVRHPMYAGAGIFVLLTPVALGSWFAIPAAVGLMLGIAVRLLAEEKTLAAALAGYKEYTQKVRYHLIPFVW
jgi:protein-S-isoprenylcysteine O-methyltransferase Ste14